jgi:hypothetical protein
MVAGIWHLRDQVQQVFGEFEKATHESEIES